MATLAITLDEVKKDLALTLALGRDPTTDWDADTIADVNRIIRAGRRKFYAAYPWRHLEELYTIVTPAVYDTGTVAVAAGVVTLTGGTFPSDAADYVFLPETSGVYEIASRDGDTQITLKDTSLTLAAGETFDLYRVHFPLPTGFAAFLDPLTIENTRDGELNELPVLPEWTLRGVGSRLVPRIDRPEAFSIFQSVDDETGIFTPFLTLYPIPDTRYTITSRVRLEPGDSLAEAGAISHPIFSELMREAILAAGEEMYLNGMSSIHRENFARMLPDFVKRDNAYKGIRHLRPRRSGRKKIDSFWIANADSVGDFPFDE